MKQIKWSEKLITHLYQQGVRKFAFCAGARNSPLVSVLSRAKGVEVFQFFNENSCGFFSLGQIKKEGVPMAVITTSGTAVAELLPAAIEAYYTQLPLVIITADRLASYRGSGAPQSIEQVGIFSDYVDQCWDFKNLIEEDLIKVQIGNKPVHINVCFDEPLIDDDVTSLDFSLLSPSPSPAPIPSPSQSRTERVILEKFLNKNKKPLIILGELSGEEKKWALPFVVGLKAPVFAECLSGFHGLEELNGPFLLSGEKFVQKKLQQGDFDSVLRIGGVPVLRAWRDLDLSLKQVPVLSISSRPFPGLSEKRDLLGLGEWLKTLSVAAQLKSHWTKSELQRVLEDDQKKAEQLKKLFMEFPKSEVGLLYQLSQMSLSEKGLPESRWYIGNSLPIREWDLVHRFTKNKTTGASRGANGIDGQVSTFLGWSQSDQENWAVLGDLTTLYDLSGLWAARYGKGQIRLVVINNGGGQIFSQLFNDSSFINKHEIEFSGWAKMWGFDYQCWASLPADKNVLSDKTIIELKPDLLESEKFWKKYKEIYETFN